MDESKHIAEERLLDFDSIKQVDENGDEYWLARDIHPLLGYPRWEGFKAVLKRAKEACLRSNVVVKDHFRDLTKLIVAGKGASREVEDVALSRYACYLIVQNGDPSKVVIAIAQTYFAVQTRRQELSDEQVFSELDDDQKRLLLRKELVEHNKRLSSAAHDAGVKKPFEYAVFQNYGYKGLYGGLGQKEIHARKGLNPKEKILDHMGHEELAANLFRATQTESKLRRENIQGKDKANQTHYNVGVEVRNTIKRLGGEMPENLPTPEKSIQQIEKQTKKQLKGQK